MLVFIIRYELTACLNEEQYNKTLFKMGRWEK